jgi:hypothetical protein
MSSSTQELQIQSPPADQRGFVRRYFACLAEITQQDSPWNRTAFIALLLLVALWALRMYTTWETWGDLSIDCGREMYVPAMLAQGKTLYRDVWFGYMPAAPYFNSLLFRLFGFNLAVLYWAGSLSVLGCALSLFLVGRKLSALLVGWTAGAVVLMQSFHAWHFCFPLPYSFSSVYGCLAACLFLWLAINATKTQRSAWLLAASGAASVALLCKLEFGAACYLVLFLLVAARGYRNSRRSIVEDGVAILPGLVLILAVALWMISLGGVDFLTQQNLASTWPSSFFFKTYGKVWLEHSGLAINAAALGEALIRLAFFAAFALEVYLVVWWKRWDARSNLLRLAVFAPLLPYVAFSLHWRPLSIFGAIFFPQDMVVLVLVTALAASWLFLTQPDARQLLPIAVLLLFSAILAFRVLLHMTPGGYPIYYNGPAILSFLLLLMPIVPRAGRPQRLVLRAELLICLACLGVASIYSLRYLAESSDQLRLVTDRGAIRVPRQVAENYKAAVSFMKEKSSAGDSVLSVPEDTSLYFLSGTECPTRLFFFTPGMLAPGKMTEEVIQEVESKRVRYLIWSNRTFPDYGAPRFGTDFDQTLGDYLTSHYRRVGPLVPNSDLGWQVAFTLWERKHGASATEDSATEKK